MGINVMQTDKDKLLTINELSQFLNIKVRTLYYLVEVEKIPYYRIGKLIRFDQDHVLNWLQTKKRPENTPH